MVLGSQGPGRVGRRRFLRNTREPPTRAARGRPRPVRDTMPSMSRIAGAYARISPKLAQMPGSTAASRFHARLHKLTRGRLGSRLLGADVLTLTTTGRRSGQPRDSPMFYLKGSGYYAVVASNAGSPKPPAWYLNLQAQPTATAHVAGATHHVRSRPATNSEVEELWPRFVDMYSGYDYYRSITTRTLPVLILEPN